LAFEFGFFDYSVTGFFTAQTIDWNYPHDSHIMIPHWLEEVPEFVLWFALASPAAAWLQGHAILLWVCLEFFTFWHAACPRLVIAFYYHS
jgi:hypothetical protein